MMYSNIGEVSKMTDLSIDTLRYYEKEQLISIKRGTNKIRKYYQEDIETIKFIKCLKSMGMEIKEIKQYVDLKSKGSSTIDQRIEILENQISIINQKAANLQSYVEMLKQTK